MNVALAAVPNLGSWRTLSLVASGFLEHMGGVQASTSALIERVEWRAWQLLHRQRQSMARLPTYGDYGIQHPTGVEGFDPRFMKMSASIRYTTADHWLILKGRSTHHQSSSIQFPTLATALTQSQHFYGAQHCPGCTEALACANGAPGLGSPEVWRRIGTTHHLTAVVEQLQQVAYP